MGAPADRGVFVGKSVGLGLAAMMVAAVLALAAPALAAPVNDNLAGATPITGSSGTKSGSNAGATTEAGEPLLPGMISTIWYQWEAPASGPVTFSGPQGTDACYDATPMSLGVYTGGAVNALTTVAPTKDYVCESRRVSFQATAGTVYKIQIGGESGYSQGTRTFSWFLDTRPRADLAVTQTKSAESIEAGQTVTYSAAVTNNGPGASTYTDVLARFDVLDGADQWISGARVTAWPSWCSNDEATGLVCALPPMTSGQTVTGDFVVRPDVGGVLESEINLMTPSSYVDPASANNRSTARTTVIGGEDPGNPSGLEVTRVTPPHNKKNVSPKTNVRAEFSHPLDPETIHEGTFTLSLGGRDVDTVVTYDGSFDEEASTFEATLNPDGRLKSGKTYTATVVGGPDGVTDDMGTETLEQDKVWKFRIR